MKIQKKIKGWNLSGANPERYELIVDRNIFYTGSKSGLLYSLNKGNEQQSAVMMQSFHADVYKGKRIKMSCFLKTELVTKCGAWLQIDNFSGDLIQYDNMDNRCIQGTTEWNHYSIVLDVPEESATIHFGVFLIGDGKVWSDNFSFEEVNEKIATTNTIFQDHLLKQPSNINFNE